MLLKSLPAVVIAARVQVACGEQQSGGGSPCSSPATPATSVMGRDEANESWQQRRLSETLVVVPIPSSEACNGTIRHLTCLKIIITSTSGGLRWDGEMSGPLCRELKAGRNQKLLPHANVGLCLQVKGHVGAVVKLQGNAGNAAETFQRSAGASEAKQFFQLLPGKPRVVSRKSLAVSGFPERYSRPAKAIDPSWEEAWSAAMAWNGNLGNLVWSYGAESLINPYQSAWFASRSDWAAALPDALVVATANLLYIPDGDGPLPKGVEGMSRDLDRIAREFNVPSLLLGIGLQAEIRDDQDINTAIHALHFHDVSVSMLTAFASRAPPAGIAVRGNVTSHLCRKAGIAACVPLGCPSFTINRASNLGAVLQHQWARVVQKHDAHAPSLKIAINLPQLERGQRFHEGVYDILIKIYTEYDAIVVLQSAYDRPQLQKRFRKAGVKWETSRIKFFVEVQAWMHELQQVDFVIGCRIHGTMAGVAAGAAALILPTDFRTLEMAQAMHLPSVSGAELNALKVETFDLSELIKKVAARHDFHAFERTRRAAIQTYSDMLRGMDLEIHPELLHVLGDND